MTVSVIEFRMQNHTDFWQKMIRLRGKIYIYLYNMIAWLNFDFQLLILWSLTLCLQCWNSTISVTISTHHNTYILFLVTVPSHYFYALERKLFGHVSLIVDSPRKYRVLVKVKCWEMVFCYQNCSDLLWEKNVLMIQKNFWNSRLKAENLQKFWDH